MGKKIRTGVDQLMSLVEESTKISFKDASKNLGVPVSTIQEWAQFLEEEHFVRIEYNFATPYLVFTQMSDAHKKTKVKRFADNKQVLATKIEMASSYFEDLDKHIVQISKVIGGVEKNMDQKLAHIDKDLRELAQAEKQKEQLDKQIITAKESSFAKIQELERHMMQSQDHFEKSYKTLKTELSTDQEMLSKSDSFLDRMKKQEDTMRKKMLEITEMARKMQAEIDGEERQVDRAATHVRDLKKERDALSKEVEAEHKNLAYILAQNHKQEELIEKMQAELFKKIDADGKRISEKEADAKKLPAQVQELLSKKRKMKDILTQIEHNEGDVKKEIVRLRHEAQMIERLIGSKNVDKELRALHEHIETLGGRKDFFKKKIADLLQVVKL